MQQQSSGAIKFSTCQTSKMSSQQLSHCTCGQWNCHEPYFLFGCADDRKNRRCQAVAAGAFEQTPLPPGHFSRMPACFVSDCRFWLVACASFPSPMFRSGIHAAACYQHNGKANGISSLDMPAIPTQRKRRFCLNSFRINSAVVSKPWRCLNTFVLNGK